MRSFFSRAVIPKAAVQRSWANTKVGMKNTLAGVGLLVLFAGSVTSLPRTCHRAICIFTVRISSITEETVYGLLIGAPEVGCRLVRYQVETAGRELLGKTPVLAAGEMGVVRIGNGFQPGDHTLLVTAEGCTGPLALLRQVTLRKASPDHGWRAARANAARGDLAPASARQDYTP
jgi:hypothetical protein